MNCVKLHETNCKYRMACDPGQCVANICQKTFDDILEALKTLVIRQKPAEPQKQHSQTTQGVKYGTPRR